MTKDSLIQQAFEVAAERYAAVGVDVRKALEDMKKISLSLHCWQADDVSGFENQDGSLTGGIQVTGNYPGRARTIDELRRDVLKAKSYIPGNHRLSLHEIYGDFQGEKVDRDEVEPHHFESWIQWAKENDFKLDFNSTSFSHPKSGDLTLANPSDDIRNFWIEHTKRCRWISDEMGKAQNDPCMMNLWIHDGSKEVPASRLRYRRILEESLDEIFATEYKWMKDCIEAKLFGIGLESYTVGSYDFYLGYGAKKNKIVTLDTGHFHLTESIADKVSSLLLFTPEIMLHVSRPIRWDSDHVVILNDDVQDLAVRSCVATPWTGYISVWIISTLPSIVSVLMSLVAVPRKKPLCSLCWSRSPCFASTRMRVSISSVLPCRRKRRVCLGVRFGICIVCKVGSRRRVLYR